MHIKLNSEEIGKAFSTYLNKLFRERVWVTDFEIRGSRTEEGIYATVQITEAPVQAELIPPVESYFSNETIPETKVETKPKKEETLPVEEEPEQGNQPKEEISSERLELSGLLADNPNGMHDEKIIQMYENLQDSDKEHFDNNLVFQGILQRNQTKQEEHQEIQVEEEPTFQSAPETKENQDMNLNTILTKKR